MNWYGIESSTPSTMHTLKLGEENSQHHTYTESEASWPNTTTEEF